MREKKFFHIKKIISVIFLTALQASLWLGGCSAANHTDEAVKDTRLDQSGEVISKPQAGESGNNGQGEAGQGKKQSEEPKEPNLRDRNAKIWGDRVFTKEEVQERLDAGLSASWANYQINACLADMDNLPENVLTSLEAAVGAYRWENYERPNFNGNWEEYYEEPDIVGQKLHALLDLYGITPDTAFPAIGKAELERKVAENPKIDMAQYATYEDGDAFLPYFSHYGSEVLAENDYVKVEGPRDITVDWYEDISRVVRITNKSEHPVYIDYVFLDKADGGSRGLDEVKAHPEYEEEFDKISRLTEDTTVLAFTPKDILSPGEMTYLCFNYGSYGNFNTHWYLKTYPVTDKDIEKLYQDEKRAYDAKAAVRMREKSEDIILIMKNRVTPKEECSFEFARIQGTLVNTEGEPIPFLPFRLTGFDETSAGSDSPSIETRECFSSVDGTFSIKVPVVLYKTDETYARYAIFVDGEKALVDGKMVTMVAGELFELDGEVQEGVKYSDYVKGRRVYGQKSAFVQPMEAKDYELTIVVPDKYDYLVYDYESEEDYGGQANYYDYGGDILATVKFHDVERGANKTAYLNVFDHDGNLILRKATGIQTCCVAVSPNGSLVGTTITPANLVAEDDFDMEYPANVGKATIFDLAGNKIFELQTGTRAMEISHDNKYVALDVNGADCVGIMNIETKEILWQDYRGSQIRHLIFSEDDSILYMGSQECIAAYDAKDGTMLWQTFTANGFPIDMILSSKYLYVSPKGTGGNDNKLMCIDRKTGKTKWTYQTGSRGTKLTVSPDETMLFWGNDTGARDVGLYMLNAETGEPLWTLNYGGQAAWFTSDSEYVAVKDYGILEVFDREGRKVATTSCGFNSKMSWFVYMKDDLSRILNIAGGGGMGNSGWLYNMVLEPGYDRQFMDSQRKNP